MPLKIALLTTQLTTRSRMCGDVAHRKRESQPRIVETNERRFCLICACSQNTSFLNLKCGSIPAGDVYLAKQRLIAKSQNEIRT